MKGGDSEGFGCKPPRSDQRRVQSELLGYLLINLALPDVKDLYNIVSTPVKPPCRISHRNGSTYVERVEQ
jgi:hypothetical protein